MKPWALVVATIVNGYLLGVMVLFATVVYPSFEAVVSPVFTADYASFTTHIAVPVVAFEALAMVTTLVLYAARPASTPISLVHVLTALGVLYFAITFAWHLPAHHALATGDNSDAALTPLLLSQWCRTVVQLVRTGLLGWLSARAMR